MNMETTLKIGSKDITFAADAALPIVYRQLFPDGSFFRDIQMIDGDHTEIVIDMAFAMAYNADRKRTGTDEVKWLKSLSDDPFELVSEHGEELIDLMAKNAQSSQEKKVNPMKAAETQTA